MLGSRKKGLTLFFSGTDLRWLEGSWKVARSTESIPEEVQKVVMAAGSAEGADIQRAYFGMREGVP